MSIPRLLEPARARPRPVARGWRAALAALALAAPPAGAQPLPARVLRVPAIEVVAPAPLREREPQRSRIPAHVQTLERETLDEHGREPLQNLLAERIAGSSLADTQGSPFNATWNLRGYSASPVLGVPQGVAVFQNGVRVNDPFGDVVHWALLPDFAYERVQVEPGASPLHGPNAQGGAVSLRTKDGFSAPGARLGADAASHPSGALRAEYGASRGELAVYGGVRGLSDAGWRDHSPADLQQALLDLARQDDTSRLQLTLGLAAADFVGNGPAPIELLDEERSAVFTRPDETDALAWDATLRGTRALGESTWLRGTTWFRSAQVDTQNGDEAEFEPCTGIAAGPDASCTNAGDDDESLLVDGAGRPVSSALAIDGALNETRTRSRTTGAAIQLEDERTLWGRRNAAVIGASADLGFVRYRARSRAGALDGSRAVDDLGFWLGGEAFETRLVATSRLLGLYASDTFLCSEALALTVSARLDHVFVDLDDRLGSDLDGAHPFVRLNPSLGLHYRFSPALAVYASYGESSRAPTPAELGCADPERACRVPNAFTADPPLDQVVTRTVELGARGQRAGALELEWSAAAYAAWNDDDILFVASGPVPGSGYFTNAGRTRRLGFEASLDARWGRLRGWLRYGFLHATFESPLELLSPSHPDADADGRIEVGRGDRLPNLPQHSFAAGLAWQATAAWTLGARARGASARRYQGDESNRLPSLPGYAVLDLETRYRIGDRIRVGLRVVNVLDAEYATAGVLGDPGEVFPGFGDPRFQSPGEPRTFLAELRISF